MAFGKRTAAFTGSLYQLHSRRELKDGSYVEINGPWDKYGVVTSSKREEDGLFLNQIRGVKPRTMERPVASF